MQILIEIPITIIHHTKAGYIQIAPAQQFDRLPAARQLDPDSSVEPELAIWQGSPANQAAQANLRERLEEVGSRVYTLLPERESLQSILDLRGQEDDSTVWRRILVYTDSESSRILIETMWSDEVFEGESLGFVVANHTIPISIVRHLGLESTASLKIESRKSLQMLVVFSNPQDENQRLGRITVEDDSLVFEGCLYEERQALDAQLHSLVRLNLLELHFLVGDERYPNNSVVYQGQVQLRSNQPFWKVETTYSCDLRNIFLKVLGGVNWHLLHYFGHGAGNIDPELVLRPGSNLSCKEIGQKISQMPRLVILNACESANPAGLNAPVLTGFATLFLLRGTVNLICMQMRATPKTATLVTRELYHRLSQSLFTRQMDFEEALHEVRRQFHDPQDPRLDFFCPVLYARPVNGPIFAYQDDRLDVWRLIKAKELTLNPRKLVRVASWSSRLNEIK